MICTITGSFGGGTFSRLARGKGHSIGLGVRDAVNDATKGVCPLGCGPRRRGGVSNGSKKGARESCAGYVLASHMINCLLGATPTRSAAREGCLKHEVVSESVKVTPSPPKIVSEREGCFPLAPSLGISPSRKEGVSVPILAVRQSVTPWKNSTRSTTPS